MSPCSTGKEVCCVFFEITWCAGSFAILGCASASSNGRVSSWEFMVADVQRLGVGVRRAMSTVSAQCYVASGGRKARTMHAHQVRSANKYVTPPGPLLRAIAHMMSNRGNIESLHRVL
jgi:hypothetical protein